MDWLISIYSLKFVSGGYNRTFCLVQRVSALEGFDCTYLLAGEYQG